MIYMKCKQIILLFLSIALLSCNSKSENELDVFPRIAEMNIPNPFVIDTGIFMLSNTKQAIFAYGNLQYNRKDKKYRFASHQYDFIESNNAGWDDLFEWGNYLVDSILVDSFWRTPSLQEMDYILFQRPNAVKLLAYININSVNGLLLLPSLKNDSAVFYANKYNIRPSTKSFTANSLTLQQWQKLESKGAVFLPAAGYRGSKRKSINKLGSYWTSTSDASNTAYKLSFEEDVLMTRPPFYRNYHYSVRLVKDMK